MIATQPPKYEYTPNDFMVLSAITVILCGILSPLTLMLSLPALFFSQQVSAQNNVVAAGHDYLCRYTVVRNTQRAALAITSRPAAVLLVY